MSGIEPITRVVMANIDSTSSANNTIGLEDFTKLIIMAEAGGTCLYAEVHGRNEIENYRCTSFRLHTQ